MNNELPRSRVFRVCVILIVALLLLAPWGLANLRIDNGIEQWVEDDGDAARYAAFREDFGGDDDLLLVYGGGDLFDEAALDLQLSVLEAIEAVPGVASVKSVPTLFRDQFGAEDPEALRAELQSSPFYERVIVSPDLSLAGMIISGDNVFTSKERRAYVAALAAAVLPLSDAGLAVHWAGPAVLNAALDTESELESARLLPAAVAASCLILLVVLRSPAKVLAASIVSSATLVVTLGIMGWLGLTMNMVTVALPPVLWVLSMAYMVHLLRYHEAALLGGSGAREALARAVSSCAWPCFLAALTTSLGFLSLCTAGMAPVRELGLAGGLGIFVAFLAAMGLGPALIVALRIRATARPTWRPGTSGIDSPFYERHGLFILGAAAAFTLCFSLLGTRVRVESNPLAFLNPQHAVVRDAAAIGEHFSGLYTLETVITLPGSWMDEGNWPAIESQAAALAAEAGVARVISPLDYLKKLHQWSTGGAAEAYRLPENREAARALIESLPEETRTPLEALVSPDGTRVRLSSLVREMDGAKLLGIVQRSEAAMAAAPEGVSGYHTGVVLRLVKAQFGLIDTQVNSLGLAVAVVFVCVGLGLRSFRLMILSFAPNLLPIAGLFGVMGLLGIPLDPATVMVAAIAVGIAVDDTLHLLSSWREGLRDGEECRMALRSALEVNGPAMVATTLTACVGFLALGLSDFAPIRYFGLLSAGTMAVAVAADLWLLPVTILLTGGRPKPRHETQTDVKSSAWKRGDHGRCFARRVS